MNTVLNAEALLAKLTQLNGEILKIVPEKGWLWEPKTYKATAVQELQRIQKEINNKLSSLTSKKIVSGKTHEFFTDLCDVVKDFNNWKLLIDFKKWECFYPAEPSQCPIHPELSNLFKKWPRSTTQRLLSREPIYDDEPVRKFIEHNLLRSISHCFGYYSAISYSAKLLTDNLPKVVEWFKDNRIKSMDKKIDECVVPFPGGLDPSGASKMYGIHVESRPGYGYCFGEFSNIILGDHIFKPDRTRTHRQRGGECYILDCMARMGVDTTYKPST